MSESDLLFDLSGFQNEEKKGASPSSALDKAFNMLGSLEERVLKNLENKANRGERLTAGDYTALKELRDRISQHQQSELPEGVVKTAKDVAIFFGRTVRTIRNWAGRGMPQLPDGYDLSAIESWALTNGLISEQVNNKSDIPVSAGSGVTVEVLDQAHYELEIKRLDSELKAVKLQKAQGVVILRQQVEKEWADRAFELKRDLLSMARRLSLRGANKDAPILYEIIRKDCIVFLEKYARGHVDVASLEVTDD